MSIKKISCCLNSLALIVGLIACGNEVSETNTSLPAGQQSQSATQTAADLQIAAFSGKVVEKHDAAPYTYVRLKDGAGNETWAAVPETPLEIGEAITLQGGYVMKNFSSKTLNRTFDAIVFASGIVRGSENRTVGTRQGPTGSVSGAVKPKAGSRGMTAQSSGGSRRAVAAFTGVKIEKSNAKNGFTVGELYANAVDLNGQKVTVKGQVVKMSPNIMGKNWLHIQDGTGDPSTNTHDLVVTSSAIVEKGTIVSLEGILAADKDFGFGYRYDVLIEEAVVVK